MTKNEKKLRFVLVHCLGQLEATEWNGNPVLHDKAPSLIVCPACGAEKPHHDPEVNCGREGRIRMVYRVLEDTK